VTSQKKSQTYSDWTGIALLSTAIWITLGLVLGFFVRVNLFSPGDFDSITAMNYHGLMVPLLVMFYLLAVVILPLEMLRGRLYAGASIAAVVLAGPTGLLNRSEGISTFSLLQISGMAVTDLLGLILLATLLLFTLRYSNTTRETRWTLWLIISAVTAILFAAPFGHLAGWGNDIGIASFPGVSSWLDNVEMTAQDFQEGIIASHSHLIAGALFSALVALTAFLYQHRYKPGRKTSTLRLGLQLTTISLLAATAVYTTSALIGWEPPKLFVSGPQGENGVPLDDVILSLMAVGWLGLIAGIRAGNQDKGKILETKSDQFIRIAVFLNWVVAFVGVILVGLYIEFNETFFGGGEFPAPGAANDAAFIRVHLLFGFLLLPIILAFLLATAEKHHGNLKVEREKLGFAFLSISGMLLGISGEWVWVMTLDNRMFIGATVIIVLAVLAGTVILLQKGFISYEAGIQNNPAG
jgi:hypothetical protein